VKRRLLLIEINEVNRNLLESATQKMHLPNLKRLLAMPVTTTFTQDGYDSGYLEPWVQWVSVHTGEPSAAHRIMHLGDVPNLSAKQLWEILSEHGIHTGVWGVMNGDRRGATACDFFVADPWTFSAPPYPQDLSVLTDLAVYIAKNYLRLSPLAMTGYGLRFLGGLLKHVPPRDLLASARILLEGVARFGPKNVALGAFFEYVSAAAFAQARTKYQPQCSIGFFNLLAHAQHHYWHDSQELSAQLTFSFQVMDRIVGRLLRGERPGEIVLAANALSQRNTNDEIPWILYRPIDPEAFLRSMQIAHGRVEALMTHDAQVLFASEAAREAAAEALIGARILGKPMFYVERNQNDPCKLFYRLDFSDPVDAEVEFNLLGRAYRFLEFFESVVRRTGKHIPDGFVFQSERIAPERMANHELYRCICAYFGIGAPELSRS
jgi:hypothetical protein